jgi:hypothetical protein
MSGNFAAKQSFDERLVNVTSRIAKPAPTSWLAKGAPERRGLGIPQGDSFGRLQAIQIRKIPGIPGDSRAQTVIERQIDHSQRRPRSKRGIRLDVPERPKKQQRR